MPKITQAVIDRLEPGQTIWENGFGVMRGRNRRIVYLTQLQRNGHRSRSVLGDDKTMTLAKARGCAISAGYGGKRVENVQALADDYILNYLAVERPDAYRKPQQRLNKHVLPVVGHKPIESVTTNDLKAIIRKLGIESPSMANHVRFTWNKLWKYGVYVDAISGETPNPMNSVLVTPEGARRYATGSRQRYASREELAALWRALCDSVHPLAPFFKLLLLTGARPSEWIDWKREDDDGEWVTFRETKNALNRSIPLSPQARAIVAAGFAATPSYKRPWEAVCAAAGLKDFNVYDMRRTAATYWHDRPILADFHTVGCILGHAPFLTAQIYVQTTKDAMRRVLQAWDAELAGLTYLPWNGPGDGQPVTDERLAKLVADVERASNASPGAQDAPPSPRTGEGQDKEQTV